MTRVLVIKIKRSVRSGGESMKGYTKFPKKHLYIILGTTGILIFILSLEVMMKVKDTSLFEYWVNSTDVGNVVEKQNLFQTYLTVNLSMYFQKIIIPMGLGIHTYFAYTKLRVNKLYVFIWTVLLLGSLAYALIAFNGGALFSYIYMALHGILVVTVLALLSVIHKHEQI